MSAASRVCAVIPARGGSKGVPGKNIRPLAGQPLIVHSIEAAHRAPAISRVIVSTDSEPIANIASEHRAEIVWRPEEISGDTASSESALLHTLDQLRESEGYQPDLVVFLQATSPLRRPGDVQNAIDHLLAEDADSLFSARSSSGFLWRVSDDAVRPLNYDPARRPRRQDIVEDWVVENGSIYVFKPWVLYEGGSRLGGKVAVYMMNANDSFEVDEPEDLELLECLARLRTVPARGTER